jgi:glyoxylase-like metal-dependent hydrolase (beta-lactamase superfamily II)
MTGATAYICETCGTQYAPSAAPPSHCAICEDDRQYVGWKGQKWITPAALARDHALRVDDDAGLLGIVVAPDFAIPQRALLLPTDAGNILWECVSLVTDGALAALKSHGGVDRIVISHPHFYSAMVDWSDALGGVPILLHEADKQWVMRSSKHIEFWSGDTLPLSDAVTLIRAGGHFPGSTALHWREGPRPGGALFPGDALQVVMDRRHVTFMYSYPNYIPMRTGDVVAMRERLRGFAFEDVYGYSWGRNILGGGRAAVDASFERHLAAVAA